MNKSNIHLTRTKALTILEALTENPFSYDMVQQEGKIIELLNEEGEALSDFLMSSANILHPTCSDSELLYHCLFFSTMYPDRRPVSLLRGALSSFGELTGHLSLRGILPGYVSFRATNNHNLDLNPTVSMMSFISGVKSEDSEALLDITHVMIPNRNINLWGGAKMFPSVHLGEFFGELNSFADSWIPFGTRIRDQQTYECIRPPGITSLSIEETVESHYVFDIKQDLPDTKEDEGKDGLKERCPVAAVRHIHDGIYTEFKIPEILDAREEGDYFTLGDLKVSKWSAIEGRLDRVGGEYDASILSYRLVGDSLFSLKFSEEAELSLTYDKSKVTIKLSSESVVSSSFGHLLFEVKGVFVDGVETNGIVALGRLIQSFLQESTILAHSSLTESVINGLSEEHKSRIVSSHKFNEISGSDIRFNYRAEVKPETTEVPLKSGLRCLQSTETSAILELSDDSENKEG